jgi:hypothetical protein
MSSACTKSVYIAHIVHSSETLPRDEVFGKARHAVDDERCRFHLNSGDISYCLGLSGFVADVPAESLEFEWRVVIDLGNDLLCFVIEFFADEAA